MLHELVAYGLVKMEDGPLSLGEALRALLDEAFVLVGGHLITSLEQQ